MNYMPNPVINGKYSEQDLREYARYRKAKDIEGIMRMHKDPNIQNCAMAIDDHEDYREPLAYSKQIIMDIQLSTGGDADGYKLTFDDNNELLSGVYYWADWGVYQEVRLDEEELVLVESLYTVGILLRHE